MKKKYPKNNLREKKVTGKKAEIHEPLPSKKNWKEAGKKRRKNVLIFCVVDEKVRLIFSMLVQR